ncbi:hypothetical protein SeMB42_g01116 [Synchytrium endobioticum]|uniref:Uncharacterized protein n=1 Tax=Synchytrium endobioticum TaxID=286115 RepID=A0A507DME9_9FUNG|nr:hypothetical protein SeMB42_g01116 [Synchytrium endobioticum]
MWRGLGCCVTGSVARTVLTPVFVPITIYSSPDGVSINNLAGVRRDRQRQVMYRFFAFAAAPHHRLASPDQFRYGYILWLHAAWTAVPPD